MHVNVDIQNLLMIMAFYVFSNIRCSQNWAYIWLLTSKAERSLLWVQQIVRCSSVKVSLGFNPSWKDVSLFVECLFSSLCNWVIVVVVVHHKVTVIPVFVCWPWPVGWSLTRLSLQNSIPLVGTLCAACTVVWCLHKKLLFCLDSGTHTRMLLQVVWLNR